MSHDDETWLERREREAKERKDAKHHYGLTGVLAVADQPNGNGVSYTKEALEAVADRFKRDGHPAYGVVFTPGKDPAQVHIADIAFRVDDVSFDGEKLETTIETLPTPQGEMVDSLLEIEEQEPGSFALAMAGLVDEKDTEERDGVRVVKRFTCTRISILPAKEKA